MLSAPKSTSTFDFAAFAIVSSLGSAVKAVRLPESGVSDQKLVESMRTIKSVHCWVFALLFLLSGRSTVVRSAAQQAPPTCEDDHDAAVLDELIQWIKDNKGIVDDRQVVKKKDVLSPSNVYAKEFIPKDTVLLSVPFDLAVEPKEYDSEEVDTSICNMVKILHDELEAYQNEGESKYAPYLKYLLTLEYPPVLPAAWSNGGKELLKKVVGDKLLENPNDIDSALRSWKKDCVKGSIVNDPMEKTALLVIGYESPSPDLEEDQEWHQMIPFYDLYYPREDDPNTNYEQDDDQEVMRVTASRDIQAGEAIHTPMGFGYTKGNDRHFIHSGVLERSHSFNFIDKHVPRKFEDMPVDFTLDRVETEDGGSIYNLTWTSGLRPHSRVYNHVEKELGRMKEISEVLAMDALYLLHPTTQHERRAIEAYSTALIDALEQVVKTRHHPRPVTAWTTRDYEVAGVNLASYDLEGVEQDKQPKTGESPYELFEDFDISNWIIGNEQWLDMIEYRRQLKRPTLSFYVDKVARKRWLPTQGMPQAKQFVTKYGFELASNDIKEEQAEEIFKLIPDDQHYAAKPSHHSEGVSVWLVSHDKEKNATMFSSTARQLEEEDDDDDKKFDKMNVAVSLSKHLHAEAEQDESHTLKNVKPGVIVEKRMVDVDDFQKAPLEFNVFVIWGRVFVAQANVIEGEDRLAATWVHRDGSIIEGKKHQERPSDLDYVDFPRVWEIAETLGRNKDMFRVDIFVGLPADSPLLSSSSTREERMAAVEYAVNESEIYPTTLFKYWPWLGQEAARLWLAGYKIGNYRTVPNDEIPKEFLENGFLPEASIV